MAGTFIQERLPIAVYADAGSTISLTDVLNKAFGSSWQNFDRFWVNDAGGADYLAANNFSYWNLTQPAVAHWNINGAELAHGFSNQTMVTRANIGQVTLTAGNSIADTLYLTVLDSSSNQVYSQYKISVVPTAVAAPVAVIDAQTIVDSALRFNAVYNGLPNPYDCGWISDAVGAAVGAPLPSMDYSLDPTQNREGGYWRIVHRGSDNPYADWQALAKPGDIVRFDYSDPAQPQHTTLIMSQQAADGTIQVFDNNLRKAGISGSFIGLHSARYDEISNPATVTIYRISPDHRNLVQGTDLGESLLGTPANDDIRSFGGNDVVYAGAGDDVIRAGAGNDDIRGDDGFDTVVIAANVSASTVTTVAGVTTVTSAEGIDTLRSVERIQFLDGVVAFDTTGNAGDAYRIYQAAFNRAPDKSGLSFWTHVLDTGNALPTVSQGFVNSAEFKANYGVGASNGSIVDRFYSNVLGRQGEASGKAFWVGTLDAGASVESVLRGFANSPENHARVDVQLAGGMQLDATALMV